MKGVKTAAVAGAIAMGVFGMMGPLQHVGAIPQSGVGDASNALIKMALNTGVEPVWACGHGGGGSKGNNGFGNGGNDGVPGKSGFQDRTR